MGERLSARDRIAQLTDSFEERDTRLRGGDPLGFDGYEEQLVRARSESGLDEACVWGFAEVDGERFALVVFDFAFLGGSMGVAVGEKVARAFDAARRTRTPVVTVTASGGARMQEGMWSLVQMAKTVEARRRHTTAGLLHITLLTSPTTGGVYASFASLADVVYAETEATVGFAGPRVVEQVTGDVSEPDAHTAEAAYAHGLIDAIVARENQRKTIIRALKALAKKRDFYHHPDTPVMAGLSQPLAAWDALQRVRAPAWPKADDILDVLLTDAIEFRGDRTGASDDEHVVTRAGPLAATQHSVVAIGQNAVGDGRIRPAGFRKAVRAIEIAGRLGLPVVTVIDTRGADPTASSEGAGVAVAIARTFDAMLACPTPTVAVLTGEGGSGGALAMASADHVLAFEKSLFSVIAPEGAATILYRDASRAPELAERLRMTVPHLLELGLVNATIPEPEGGVTGNPLIAMQILASAVGGEVERLAAMPQRRRLRLRARRWRDVAKPSVRRRRGR